MWPQETAATRWRGSAAPHPIQAREKRTASAPRDSLNIGKYFFHNKNDFMIVNSWGQSQFARGSHLILKNNNKLTSRHSLFSACACVWSAFDETAYPVIATFQNVNRRLFAVFMVGRARPGHRCIDCIRFVHKPVTKASCQRVNLARNTNMGRCGEIGKSELTMKTHNLCALIWSACVRAIFRIFLGFPSIDPSLPPLSQTSPYSSPHCFIRWINQPWK